MTTTRHLVGAMIYGGTFHVSTEEKPEGAGPHDPFWQFRDHVVLCGRTVWGVNVSDRYVGGALITPICKNCARIESAVAS